MSVVTQGNVVYSWRPGSKFNNKTAAPAAEELERIKTTKRSSRVSAQDVVAFAAETRGVLYDLIGDWDDSVAGPKWRLECARSILRSIEIKFEDSPQPPARCYYHINIEDTEAGSAYVPTFEILEAPDMRAQLLRRALDEALSWRRRYNELIELASVFEAVESVQREIEKRGVHSTRAGAAAVDARP